MLGQMRFLVVLALHAATAHAAPCGDDLDAITAVAALEAIAADPSMKLDASYLDRCYRDLGDPAHRKLAERFLRACQPILERDAAHRICVSGAVHQGKKSLFGVDFLEAVRGWDQSPWNGTRTLELFALLSDPAAVATVVETWKTSIDEAAQRERTLEGWQRKQARLRWTEWRVQAAALFGALGNNDVFPFLVEQAKTEDRAVARACRDAIRAIERR